MWKNSKYILTKETKEILHFIIKKQEIFDVWNEDIEQFHDLKPSTAYNLVVKDAMVKKFKEKTSLAVAKGGKIEVTNVNKNNELKMANLQLSTPCNR